MQTTTKVILALLAALLLVEAAFSVRWPITHDEAPLFYEAFLMHDEGRVPYRDIFDFQMPGSFAAYYVLGILSGFGDVRIRLLDLLILSVLIAVTFFAMRSFGKSAALAGALLFGLKYLQGGPSMSLQREYLLLIFLALTVWIAMRDELTVRHRLALGLLFGLAASLKPHAAIGLVPILLFDIIDMVKRRGLTFMNAASRSTLPVLLGFVIPVVAVIAWLFHTRALAPFLSIATNYWPLYAQINGELTVNTGAARWLFILDQVWRLGGNGLWLIPALIGIYLNSNRKAYLLASLALCYAIYPAFSGQFFPYHYIPFLYFIVLLASLVLSTNVTPIQLRFSPLVSRYSELISRYSFLILLLIVLINIRPSTAFIRQLQGKSIVTSTDRAVEIARYLEKNLEAGDTVQPLDWTGGTLLAMLKTQTPIATPYIFDFYFYHHISSPYIQSLRTNFIKDLQEARPRFIVRVTAIDKPWVSGADTSRELFPELGAFLNENYSSTIQKDDYVIYERR